MSDAFDPYYQWLAIPPEEHPPSHYRLLGLKLFEENPDVIERAADRQMGHLRTFQTGPHGELSQKLLNEVAAAKLCLLQPEKKAAYDGQLRKKVPSAAPPRRRSPRSDAPDPRAAEVLARAEREIGKTRSSTKKKTSHLPLLLGAGAVGVLLVVVGLIVWGLSSVLGPDEVVRQDSSSAPPTEPEPIEEPTVTEVEPGATGSLPASAKPEELEPPPEAAETDSQETEAVTEPEPEPPPVESPPVEPPADEPKEKHSVPSEAVQKAVAVQLNEAYELDKSRPPAERLELANKLLELAGGAKQAAERFVLLRKAMELAGDGGDAVLMLEVVDAIGADFKVDALGVKDKVLRKFAAAATDTKSIKSFIEASRGVVEEALAEKRYETALTLVDGTYRLCMRSAGKEFRKQAYQRRNEVRKIHQGWQEFRQTLAKLKTAPDDADAHLLVGRWYCFSEGDWEHGLPHLAKGSDRRLKDVAAMELAGPPSEAGEKVKIGDAWWAAAETEKGGDKPAMMCRAGHWYRQAEGQLDSVVLRDKLARRLEEIGAITEEVQTKEDFPLNKWVDVLKLVDLQRDAVKGKWGRRDNAITMNREPYSRMMLPATVEGDYDLRLEFTRLRGNGGVNTHVPVGMQTCILALSAWSGEVSGLGLIDGQEPNNNVTTKRPGTLINGQKYSLLIGVRLRGDNATIAVSIDGVPYIRWTGKQASLSSPEAWRLPESKRPGLGGYDTTVTFHSAQLRRVSGKASWVRPVGGRPDERRPGSDSGPRVPRRGTRLRRPRKLADNAITVNNAEKVQLLATLSGHTGSVRGVSFSPDGSLLASASDDRTARLWKLATRQVVETFTGHNSVLTSVDFIPDGSILASGSDDKTVKLWNVRTGRLLGTLSGHTGSVRGVAFSPDGAMLASTSYDSTVKLWNVTRGRLYATLSGHTGWIGGVTFSPNGSLLASAGHDRTVKLWNPLTGQLRATLQEHTDKLEAIGFNPDGSTLASGSFDRTVILWDMGTGKIRRTLVGHTGTVESVAFSADGSIVASGCDHKTVRLWNVATGELRRTLVGHSGGILCVAFSPDGSMLASGSSDSTVKLWGLAPRKSR